MARKRLWPTSPRHGQTGSRFWGSRSTESLSASSTDSIFLKGQTSTREAFPLRSRGLIGVNIYFVSVLPIDIIHKSPTIGETWATRC
ncbi:hypothetical protein ASPVEDRAFT_43610 [Aspergillus versicolor CBS 583.65]|uniref:Uncharacterized protein n=1 Tax=Aspergillus versicolor CBS 583.65 TaxID=1036611 RepID=A0A1L9PRL4_ASPVE|nr:uncharacterized protein ASPVEDRAFT_43610 [Aspergillus versicolor CBS 583.65]OJJ04143.1 hypothetical protein ASPVEDRAFT_43610 [Aspergillus versicolor CBS 583.65]